MSGLSHAFASTLADAAAHGVADAAADAAATNEAPADGVPGTRLGPSRGSRQWLRDLVLVGALAGLVALAWEIGQLGWVRPQEPLGYWLGVAGATMMLLLFLYPLRKYAGWMRRAGKVKGWFWFHLVMGVAGPWLVLVHAAFRTGSLNAAVALYSMAVVVASGVIGRFLYVRLNVHLDDALASLQAVRRKAGLAGRGAAGAAGAEGNGLPALHYAEAVAARLEAFEARELHGASDLRRDLRQVMLLPMQRRFALWRCLRDLRAPLAARAAAGRWSADEHARRRRRLHRLVDDHLEAVVRVARHRAFGRVFALWHVAHLPFVILLAISAAVHVIAVHAY